MRFEKISYHQFSGDWVGPNDGGLISAAYDSIKIPQRSTACSAGYDISTPISFRIEPGGTIKIPTGLRVVGMPKDVVLLGFVRSSIGIKRNIVLSNGTMILDSDYADAKNEGHMWIALRNMGNAWEEFHTGDKICQGVFVNYLLTDDDNADGVRVGGIGSTGK